MALPKTIISAMPGATLGRYKLGPLLGEGGMGRVFKSRDAKKRRPVAIKVLNATHAGNEEMVKRFLREAKVINEIDHQNIVEVYDVGRDNGHVYCVMEFLEGEPLERVLSRKRPVKLARALEILLAVARALEAAHERGVVHRDLKPDNIFLLKKATASGVRVKVLDVDVPRTVSRPHGETGEVGDDAIAHERADAHGRVVAAADGMADAGIDAEDGEPRRQRQIAQVLGGLAQQLEQVSFPSGDHRHLIHHAAGGAGDEVLGALAQQRGTPRLDVQPLEPGERSERRGFEGGRGADSLAFRHVRFDDEVEAARELQPFLPHQHRDHAGRVRGPVEVGPRKQRPHLVVGHARIEDGLGRHLHGTHVAVSAPRRHPQHRPRPARHGHARALGNRPLQDERTRVVGDAAHDVEPPWRRRRRHAALACVERPRTGCRDGGAKRVEVSSAHGVIPWRARAARSTGSTSARIAPFA